MGCNVLLQGIFLTQGPNWHLLHWQLDSLSLRHRGSLFLHMVTTINVLAYNYSLSLASYLTLVTNHFPFPLLLAQEELGRRGPCGSHRENKDRIHTQLSHGHGVS